MAGISAIQRILDNQLTSKFARSLKHSDLPEGWADNPEIVQLAEDAYKEAGTESPWFKAWFGDSKVVDEAGKPVYGYHKTDAETPIEVFKTDNGYGYGGAFFNDVESVANGFGRNPNGKTYEVFLNLRDPLEVNANAALYYNIERPVWMPGRGTADTVEIANFGRNIKKDGAIIRDVVEPTGFGTDYIAFDPTSIKSTSNRGTFNPADPNIYKGLIPAVGAGGLLALMDAEEAEAAPAVKDFAKRYAKAVADGDKRMMYAGSLEPNVFEEAAKKDSGLQNNRVFMGPHGGEARLATGEMVPDEVGRHVENLLNSGETRALPNFPTNNYRNNTKNMLYLNDGKDIVAPFMAGRSGDIVLRTAFEPQKDRMKFIDGLLGRPKAPISGLRSDPASAQPQGLSVVSKPSIESTIPASSNSRKAIIPLAAGGVLLPATATGYQFPADKRGTVRYEAGLESPSVDPVDVLLAPIGAVGAGAKAAAMAAEPFISYGMDKIMGGLLSMFGDEEE